MSMQYKFNDDLLANPGDIKQVSIAYPLVAHVLDFPELREHFSQFDVLANRAKRNSRRAGYLAVSLTCAALLAASAAPIYHHEHWGKWISIAAAIFGLAGALIAFFGLLHGKAKHEWLANRLMTERLRQYHFQYIVSRIDKVLASLSGPDSASDYRAERARSFSAFRQRFDSHLEAELNGVITDEERVDPWLDKPLQKPLHNVATNLPSSLFDAYRDLRLRHQLNYANWVLRQPVSLFEGSLRAMRRMLTAISLGCVLLLFVIDMVAAIALPLDATWFPDQIVHVIAICLAILALASRAIEEGTQTRVEISRYQDYRSSVHELLVRFESASSNLERLEVMVEMERLSYLEMKSFLVAHDEASFVM